MARIFCAETNSWIDVSENTGTYRPEDIMILVSSHGRIPLLINALDAHGVPAMAGKQGVLLNRPVIQPLMSVLWLLTATHDKSAALAVARSAIVGMDDSSIISHLSNFEGNQLEGLISVAPNAAIVSLLERLHYLSSNGKVRDAIETVIDHSDLLYSYPRESDRQDI